MARLGLLYIATLALVLVTSAAPCHDKGEVAIGEPSSDGLEYLDQDIGNFDSDDDLGGSDDELDADGLAGGLDPSELDEAPLDDDHDFGEGGEGGGDGFPELDYPEHDFLGPDDFGAGDGFGPDCGDGHNGHDHESGKGSLINIATGHIGTGDVDLSGVANGLLNVAGLDVTDNLNDLNAL